jgi:arylsulfatase A-like enzyme
MVYVVLSRRYADKYKGKFDDGYEAHRESVLPRMIEKGMLPKDTTLTPINPMPKDVAATAPGDAVRPWNSLNADEKKLFARMAEVYAGFSEYTDTHVGRIVEYLEQTKQLENTVIFYCADNGASGEGTRTDPSTRTNFSTATRGVRGSRDVHGRHDPRRGRGCRQRHLSGSRAAGRSSHGARLGSRRSLAVRVSASPSQWAAHWRSRGHAPARQP